LIHLVRIFFSSIRAFHLAAGDRTPIDYAKRRYRDAEETMAMLKESLLDFSEGIDLIAVQTMMMLVGDDNLTVY
jgi:hypothetical protein